ncbi:penicillin-binding protein activator LpoB [Pseudoalteromonas sp. KS88]|uniref:penicillin-binding protein activator LpoB n=1 Tax=Pseudoalteromonas sp. KS88 TaxID=2109918 RepID=UPI00107FE86D|nr:penicillin-binding protein activator LpoB [Pseudoalteromonas sp. KS88]TGE81293.1 penicillin-binding protein activator LpoB [Pseudoalteromonas sp. KS88]
MNTLNRTTSFTKLTGLALVGLSTLVLSGCANKAVVSYGDAQAVETTDINFGSTDLQKVASQMTDSLLSSPVIGTMTANTRPIVFVERIKNKTSEHIDTESITDSISTQLLRSGKFRFVDMSRVEAAREQLTFQNEDALVNPATAVAFGQQVGAQYMLYGNLSSIVKSNADKADVYYKFTMRLMDLKSGLVEWADETEIRKTREKSTFGW